MYMHVAPAAVILAIFEKLGLDGTPIWMQLNIEFGVVSSTPAINPSKSGLQLDVVVMMTNQLCSRLKKFSFQFYFNFNGLRLGEWKIGKYDRLYKTNNNLPEELLYWKKRALRNANSIRVT